MDDLIKIEFRGIAGLLPLGSVCTVEHCEAGVLTVRLISGAKPIAAEFAPLPEPPAEPAAAAEEM